MNKRAGFRKSHNQLPSGNEIVHIAQLESKRPRDPSKESVTFAKFETISELLKALRIRSDIFYDFKQPSDKVLESGSQIIVEAVGKLLQNKLSPEVLSLLDEAYGYLSEEDEPQKSDYIFVFGAPSNLRAQKAIDLFKDGLASKIIFTGRGPHYEKSNKSEALAHSEFAIQNGIDAGLIIIEDSSITTPDNIRSTLNMLDSKKYTYKSFILVNSPYCQRRGWCTFQKYIPESVVLYRVNSSSSEKFDKLNWYKNEDGIRVILGEYVKLRNALTFNDA